VDGNAGKRGGRGEGETRGERKTGDAGTRREEKGRGGRIMTPEWNGIERRLERLKGCLLKPEPLKTKTSDEFASDPYLDQE